MITAIYPQLIGGVILTSQELDRALAQLGTGAEILISWASSCASSVMRFSAMMVASANR
jgi:hypothetical protein